jgi:hypothetical protein
VLVIESAINLLYSFGVGQEVDRACRTFFPESGEGDCILVTKSFEWTMVVALGSLFFRHVVLDEYVAEHATTSLMEVTMVWST